VPPRLLTTQAITRGVAFRFGDVRDMLRDEAAAVGAAAGRAAAAPAPAAAPLVHSLRINFRTHSGAPRALMRLSALRPSGSVAGGSRPRP
jgi:hypothetical protein